jgi:hypothetical protein
VIHACNPSYLGSRDLEDHGSKPAEANSWGHPIWKKPFTKKAGGVAQGLGPLMVVGHLGSFHSLASTQWHFIQPQTRMKFDIHRKMDGTGEHHLKRVRQAQKAKNHMVSLMCGL